MNFQYDLDELFDVGYPHFDNTVLSQGGNHPTLKNGSEMASQDDYESKAIERELEHRFLVLSKSLDSEMERKFKCFENQLKTRTTKGTRKPNGQQSRTNYVLQKQKPKQIRIKAKKKPNTRTKNLNKKSKGAPKPKYGNKISSSVVNRTTLKKEGKQPRRSNSTIIETGKDLFKLLIGQLWVITGGASLKELSPFSKSIGDKIGMVLAASQEEIESIQDRLKYLLTNSRRTFTEFILEVLLGILSLKHSKNPPQISVRFWKLLNQVNQFQKKGNVNGNEKQTQKIKRKEKEKEKFFNSAKEKKKEKEKEIVVEVESNRGELLNKELESIYSEIFTEELALYWFEKRFVERMEIVYDQDFKNKFYNEHLFYFSKSKFMLTCLILIQKYNKLNAVTKQYYHLIDLPFNNQPLNLYSNNRGKKQRLTKDLIVKYGLNSGEYWKVLSQDYISQMCFGASNLFDHFPFKAIIENPLLKTLCCENNTKVTTENPKKRVIASKGSHVHSMSNIHWILKKTIF
ncbi:hypothetical protein M0812_20163 [Anaeramoeba flamelloides]|uniref:Uncharacterized protein n=1 Tax=Anaeramoeba flamelloides TaxID=1746091 RepID=A0AAV7YX89_9EUKA|nr:hypothetical protein M0812_20163 [Anaeramoeba flamelloides]